MKPIFILTDALLFLFVLGSTDCVGQERKNNQCFLTNVRQTHSLDEGQFAVGRRSGEAGAGN